MQPAGRGGHTFAAREQKLRCTEHCTSLAARRYACFPSGTIMPFAIENYVRLARSRMTTITRTEIRFATAQSRSLFSWLVCMQCMSD